MMQEFNVLLCYSCKIFQVDQVKKSTNKWTCKVCNQKQSVKQIFFQGNGKDCRRSCQKLNMNRQTKIIHEDKDYLVNCQQEDEENIRDDFEVTPNNDALFDEENKQIMNSQSKWSNFLEEKNTSKIEDDTFDDEVLVGFRGERTIRTKRKHQDIATTSGIGKRSNINPTNSSYLNSSTSRDVSCPHSRCDYDQTTYRQQETTTFSNVQHTCPKLNESSFNSTERFSQKISPHFFKTISHKQTSKSNMHFNSNELCSKRMQSNLSTSLSCGQSNTKQSNLSTSLSCGQSNTKQSNLSTSLSCGQSNTKQPTTSKWGKFLSHKTESDAHSDGEESS